MIGMEVKSTLIDISPVVVIPLSLSPTHLPSVMREGEREGEREEEREGERYCVIMMVVVCHYLFYNPVNGVWPSSCVML